MTNVLHHLYRGGRCTLLLLRAAVLLSIGFRGRLTLLRFDETQIAQLWQKLRDAAAASQVVLRADCPQTWGALSINRAALFLRQLTQLRQDVDFRRQIWQRRELFLLEATVRHPVSVYRIAWILWWEQVAGPALQLLGWPLQSRDVKVGSCRVATGGLEAAIVGWYGSETLGDAAILGEILSGLREQGIADRKIAVFGTYPARTRITLDEMGCPEVGSQSLSILTQCGDVTDLPMRVVFGGGPLCDGRPLLEIALLLVKAGKSGRRVWLWGVGVGPVVRLEYRQAIAQMMRAASRISFRDETSRQLAYMLEPTLDQTKVSVFADPALGYLWRWRKSLLPFLAEPGPAVRDKYCLVAGRALPRLAGENLTTQDFADLRNKFDRQLRCVLSEIVVRGWKIRLIPHEYWPEDDRDYFAELVAPLPFRDRIELIDGALTVHEALQCYRQAEMILAGRFHAAVFAVALNKPFVALDYIWSNGKTTAFLSQVGMENQGFGLAEFLTALPEQVVDRLLAADWEWSPVNAGLAEEVKNHVRFFFDSD